MSEKVRTERGYFSFRWAIPEYIFILLVLGINHIPLLEFLKATGAPEAFGAFLAFLSLLTGSALGFLVTQLHWWRFHKKGRIFGIEKYEQIEDILTEYGYVSPEEIKEEKQRATGAVLDFTIHLGEDNFLAYAWRRWDMYHLLSSTYDTLLIGLFVGIICRINFEFSHFGSSLRFVLGTLENHLCWVSAEAFVLLLIFICVVILLMVFKKGSQQHIDNYRPMFEALIRNSISRNEKRIKKAFPRYFPKKN